MTAPLPTLVYRIDRPGAGIVQAQGGGMPFLRNGLARVSTIEARRARNGLLEVWARGPLLKADGSRGQFQRDLWVSVFAPAEQPEWLQDILHDAVRRLAL